MRPSPPQAPTGSRRLPGPAESPRHWPPATLAHVLISLDAVYRQLARPWPADELAERYHAAYERGADDLPAREEPPARPIALLATAIARLISLAVAANVLHLLQPARASPRRVVAARLRAGRRLTRAHHSCCWPATPDRPRPAGRPVRRARDRLPRPRRARRARGDHRLPRTPPVHLRVFADDAARSRPSG
jgi:hypothetical protein